MVGNSISRVRNESLIYQMSWCTTAHHFYTWPMKWNRGWAITILWHNFLHSITQSSQQVVVVQLQFQFEKSSYRVYLAEFYFEKKEPYFCFAKCWTHAISIAQQEHRCLKGTTGGSRGTWICIEGTICDVVEEIKRNNLYKGLCVCRNFFCARNSCFGSGLWGILHATCSYCARTSLMSFFCQ